MKRSDIDGARELASGSLDGVLDAEEQAELEAALEARPELRAELAGLAAVREAVRALPPVDPPAGLLREVVGRRRRQRVAALAGVAAAAAAWLLVLGAAGPVPSVEPPVEDFVAGHASVTRVGATIPAGVEIEPVDFDATPEPFRAPVVMGADGQLRLDQLHRWDSGLQAVYRDGSMAISVFAQLGQVDWTALPASGRRIRLGDHDAWRSEDPRLGGEVLVVQRGDAVLTVVVDTGAPEAAALAEELARAMPDAGEPSLMGRVRRACRDLAATLSPIAAG